MNGLIRKVLILLLGAALGSAAQEQATEPLATGPGFAIDLATIRSGFDGKTAWMNPMAGVIPRPGKDPLIVVTLQKSLLSASDVYYAVNEMRSEDMGRTWTEPVERPALGRRPGPEGMVVGIISLAPKWNASARKLLAVGGTSYFIGDRQNREGPKRPGYTIYNPEGREWSPWVALKIPDEPKFHMADPGCCQRVDLPDGTVLQPVYFKAAGITAYSTTVLRCSFDGETLAYRGHGDELTLPFDPDRLPKNLSFDQRQFIARQSGLFEPSLTHFRDRYLLTMRNVKDNYVASGSDGLHFDQPRPWTFDDGKALGSQDTQTHWVSHGDRLFLVYTRRGANNDHVFRHRAPLFIARVDPTRLCLVRSTERILIPEHGAGLGNCIGVTEISDRETWVTTAESMQDGGKDIADFSLQKKLGANNRSFAARIIWNRQDSQEAADGPGSEGRAGPLVPPGSLGGTSGPALPSNRLLLLQRPTCRIGTGTPGEDGSGWAHAPALPSIRAPALRPQPPPRTTVRALADNSALCIRFDCETKDPRTLIEGANGGDRVWIEIYPGNDPVERLRFEEDFRGDRKTARLRRITGESSLEVVPDVWEAKAKAGIPDADVPIYHGLQAGGWYAEFVIPWKVLGASGRPAAIGFGYGRAYGDTAPRAVRWEGVWPAVDEAELEARILEPGQALLGPEAVAPLAWETDSPRFGPNRGRLGFANKLDRPLRLLVRTVGPNGASIGGSEVPLAAGADFADFGYQLERAFDSHIDVFSPQRVVLELEAPGGARVYSASVPFGRHLGVCVDEAYGEDVPAVISSSPTRRGSRQAFSGDSNSSASSSASGKAEPLGPPRPTGGPSGPALPRSPAFPEGSERSVTSREQWLQTAIRELPRLERRTTREGAPSDFCLVLSDGTVAANLMAEDAWDRLAGIVESRFASAEERLVGAMALVGQKSVTNLFLDPLHFNSAGDEEYHSAMHEMLGPLSIVRYGGGTAVCRAAVLARLLQHIRDPATGRPFVTRVISLAGNGGPKQVDRRYPKVSNLAPFVQVPGRIGAVAVDYRGSQTLLDPTALAFFPASGRLATLEEIRADSVLRRAGAGRLADAYGRIDIDEIRHEAADRLLSRGVFPEQAPEEDGRERPYNMGYRFQAPVVVAAVGGPSPSAEFLDDWGQAGVRHPTVSVAPSGDGWRITVAVRGVPLAGLDGRDRRWERVHLLFDCRHTHLDFLHFTASAAGNRGAWEEESEAIQTYCKHLATENWREISDLGATGWKAEFVPAPNGYDAVFEIPLKTLGLDETPPVMGFNAWVEGRSPHYEELFLAPPGRRLPADPMTFADFYPAPPPSILTSIDLGIPTWMDNVGVVRLSNPGDLPAMIRLQASDRLSARRETTLSPAVAATVPGHGTATLDLPYFLDPQEKMETGGAQLLLLEASAAGKVFYRSSWKATYGGPLSVYQRYGSELGSQPKPAPGDPYYVERLIRWMSARLPKFSKRTTRDGARSDFVLRAEDGSAEFDLMDPAALRQLAAYVEGRFQTDFERVLALYCLDLEPSIGRHNSGGHHLMYRAEPISILRGNFAGGGGNCGFHSALFAGLSSQLRLGGRPLGTRTVPVWGHDIMALDWRGSRALFDNDSGNLFLTPDGRDFATIEEFRANPWLLSNAGPGEIGRYYSFSEEAVRSEEPGVGGVSGPGIFPESTLTAAVAPEARPQPGMQ